jgi:hypothetical protein
MKKLLHIQNNKYCTGILATPRILLFKFCLVVIAHDYLKYQKTISLPQVLNGCETLSLKLRDEHNLGPSRIMFSEYLNRER